MSDNETESDAERLYEVLDDTIPIVQSPNLVVHIADSYAVLVHGGNIELVVLTILPNAHEQLIKRRMENGESTGMLLNGISTKMEYRDTAHVRMSPEIAFQTAGTILANIIDQGLMDRAEVTSRLAEIFEQ
ncbi:MAG: hypothetical protein ACK4JY_13735 [Brevundimonas sp.]